MKSALRIQAEVLPGKKLEIRLPETSTVGDTVEVLILLPETQNMQTRSVIDILNELEGQRLFKTPEEADRYLQEERESWER